MPVVVSELRAIIELDDSRFQEGMRDVNRTQDNVKKKSEETGDAFDRLGKRMDGLREIGVGLSLRVTAPVALFGATAIKAASDTAESLGKVGVVFGQSAGEIKAWAATSAQAFGQSRQQALEAAGTFGNLFTAMGIGQGEAAKLSMNITQLGADLGSLNNRSAADALVALRAGLIGETEPLRAFGVNLSAATVEAEAMRLGLAKSKDELTAAAKAQAAYSLILKQTGNAQGDFARTAEGMANKGKSAQALFINLQSDIGEKFLPVANQVLSWGIKAIQFFSALPQPLQDGVIGFTLFAAALGPVILAVTSAIKAVDTVRKGIDGLIALKDAAVLAWNAKTAAISLNTRALAANTGAAGANAVAQSGAAGAGLGGRALGFAGMAGRALFNPFTAAAAAGVGLGYGAAVWSDKAQGKADVDFGTTMKHLNPFRRERDDNADTDAEAEAARQEVLKRNNGLTPRQAILAQQNAQRESITLQKSGTAAELTHAQDAEYQARLESARKQLIGSPETQKAESEAKALIPALQGRVEQLNARARELGDVSRLSAKDQAEYWNLQRDITQTEGSITELQHSAAKERQDNVKKAAEQLKQAQDLAFGTMLAQAQAAAENGPENEKAQREAGALLPIIAGRQRQLETEARALQAEARKSIEANIRYNEMAKEYTELQSEENRLRMSAIKEQNDAEEKEAQNRREAVEARMNAESALVDLQLDSAKEGEQAAMAAELKIPLIRRNQDYLLGIMKQQGPEMKEYWQDQKEIIDMESQVNDLNAKSAEERKKGIEKIKTDAEKAKQASLKSANEAKNVEEARIRLLEAQLKNVAGLSDQQRKQMLIPALQRQLQNLSRPVEGESELDRLNRETDAQGLLSRINQSAFGGGAGLRAFGGGTISLTRNNGAMPGFLPGTAPPRVEAKQLAQQSAQGRPVILQILLDRVDTRQGIETAINRIGKETAKRLFPGMSPGD